MANLTGLLPSVGQNPWSLNAAIEAVNNDTESRLLTGAAPELIRDTMGTALVAGDNIEITVNDAGDTITIDATGGGGGDVSDWGDIGGNLSDQLDLAAALNDKADVTDLEGKADDSSVVKLTGNQSVGGVKTFTSAPVVPDDSFGFEKMSGLAGIDQLPAGSTITVQGDVSRPTDRTDIVVQWANPTLPAEFDLSVDIWLNN